MNTLHPVFVFEFSDCLIRVQNNISLVSSPIIYLSHNAEILFTCKFTDLNYCNKVGGKSHINMYVCHPTIVSSPSTTMTMAIGSSKASRHQDFYGHPTHTSLEGLHLDWSYCPHLCAAVFTWPVGHGNLKSVRGACSSPNTLSVQLLTTASFVKVSLLR